MLTLAIALLVLWALCVLVFKITVGTIHLLLAIAVIALIAHFVRRKAPPPPV